LHTPQIGWNEKLHEWVVLDGMGSITLHSIPSLFCKTKQWNIIISHSIPFHSITLHQSKHSLNLGTTYITKRRRTETSKSINSVLRYGTLHTHYTHTTMIESSGQKRIIKPTRVKITHNITTPEYPS
jgi:hypothetical protein